MRVLIDEPDIMGGTRVPKEEIRVAALVYFRAGVTTEQAAALLKRVDLSGKIVDDAYARAYDSRHGCPVWYIP